MAGVIFLPDFLVECILHEGGAEGGFWWEQKKVQLTSKQQQALVAARRALLANVGALLAERERLAVKIRVRAHPSPCLVASISADSPRLLHRSAWHTGKHVWSISSMAVHHSLADKYAIARSVEVLSFCHDPRGNPSHFVRASACCFLQPSRKVGPALRGSTLLETQDLDLFK